MRLVLLTLAVAACSGDTPQGPDAANLCAGSAYDPCNDEHNCPETAAAICMPVGANHIAVCTVGCTPGGAACPNDSTGAPGTCNANSVCEPSAFPTCNPHP